MANKENIILDNNERNHIIDCIINCFLDIKELKDIFLSLDQNEIKQLSPISKQFYNLLTKKEINFFNIENEIKEHIKDKNSNIFENIIKAFTSTLNNPYLFILEKEMIEKCLNCSKKKSKKIYKESYHSFDLKSRIIHDNIFLEKFFDLEEILDVCRECKNQQYLLKSDYLYLPQILIIILIYDKTFKYKINYPTKDFNIEGFIKKNDEKENLEKYIFKYNLKMLIYKDDENNYKNYKFTNDNDYKKFQNEDKFKNQFILFYKRTRIDSLDKIYEIKNKTNIENKIFPNKDKDFTLYNKFIDENKYKNQKEINNKNLIINENINNEGKNRRYNSHGNIIKENGNNINYDINNFNNNGNNFNMKSQNILNNNFKGFINNDFNKINNIQMNNNIMNKNIYNNPNILNNNSNFNNFNFNFPNNYNFNNNNFNNNHLIISNNINNNINNFNNKNNFNSNNNFYNNNNINYNNNFNFNNNLNYNNEFNNKHYFNNFNNNNNNFNNKNNEYNNINNNKNIYINNNLNNIKNNNLKSDENKNLCLFFNFEEYKKEIYIDINEEETFSKTIEELKYKYSWLNTLKNLKYIFNGKEIKEQNKKIKEIGLKDLSIIYIKL